MILFLVRGPVLYRKLVFGGYMHTGHCCLSGAVNIDLVRVIRHPPITPHLRYLEEVEKPKDD